MQSFFQTFLKPQEPPIDELDGSSGSDVESEAGSVVAHETKKILAGGDERLHYEAPKPWTIRQPVYDKPLPKPMTTPRMETEVDVGRASPAPALQSRRESVASSTGMDSGEPETYKVVEPTSLELPESPASEHYRTSQQTADAEGKMKDQRFRFLPSHEDHIRLDGNEAGENSTSAVTTASQEDDMTKTTKTTPQLSDAFKRGQDESGFHDLKSAEAGFQDNALDGAKSAQLGVVDGQIPAVDQTAEVESVEVTPGIKAVEFLESRVADAHFPEEIYQETDAMAQELITGETLSEQAIGFYESRVADSHFAKELPTSTLSSIIVAGGQEICSPDGVHETALPGNHFTAHVEGHDALEHESESGKARANMGGFEKYELDSVDQAWLYGSSPADEPLEPAFGVLPSGVVEISSHGKSEEVSEQSEILKLNAAKTAHDEFTSEDGEIEGASAGSELEISEFGSDHVSGADLEDREHGGYFSLGDVEWKPQQTRQRRSSSSTANAANPIEESESRELRTSLPQLHSEMKSASVESLNLAIAEASMIPVENHTTNQLVVSTEAQEAGVTPLVHTQEHENTLVTSGALGITARMTLAGASIGVLMTAAREVKSIHAEKALLDSYRDNFDRVLSELEYRVPVFDEDHPESRIDFNRVLRELRMKVPVYDPSPLESSAGQKRSSIDAVSASKDEEDILESMKKTAKTGSIPVVNLEGIVVCASPAPEQQSTGKHEQEGVSKYLAAYSERIAQETLSSHGTPRLAADAKEKELQNAMIKDLDGADNETALGLQRVLADDGEAEEDIDQNEETKVDVEEKSAKLSRSQRRKLAKKEKARLLAMQAAAGDEKDQSEFSAEAEAGHEDGKFKRSFDQRDRQSSAVGAVKSTRTGNQISEAAADDNGQELCADSHTIGTVNQIGESPADDGGQEVCADSHRLSDAEKQDKTPASAGVIYVSSKKKKMEKKALKEDKDSVYAKEQTESNREGLDKKDSKQRSLERTGQGILAVGVAKPDEKSILQDDKPSKEKEGASFKAPQDVSAKKIEAKPTDQQAGTTASVASGDKRYAANGSAKEEDAKSSVSVANGGMKSWAEQRYEQWLQESITKLKESADHSERANAIISTQHAFDLSRYAQNTDLAATKSADEALIAIDVARGMKGDVDTHCRSYDWPFWSRLVETIRQNPYSDDVQALKPSVIEHVVNQRYAGVPQEARKIVWLYLSDNSTPNNVLRKEASDARPLPYLLSDQVQVDVNRTFPNEGDYSAEKKKLSAILQDYAREDPTVGYCSAISLLAGVLTLELDQQEASTLLKRLLFHYDLRRHYLRGLEGSRLRHYQFEKLLERFRPELAQHLSEIACPTESIVGRWFSTCFAYRCPLELVNQIYDLLILEGNPVLFKMALAFFAENEKELMSARNPSECLDFFTNHTFDVHGHDYKKWISVAGGFDISSEFLESLSKSFNDISRQSQILGASENLATAHNENQLLATQIHQLSVRLDAMMIDRERLIRDSADDKLKIMSLVEENYRLSAALYEERAERARDMAVAEMETQHLVALFKNRIDKLEKQQQ